MHHGTLRLEDVLEDDITFIEGTGQNDAFVSFTGSQTAIEWALGVVYVTPQPNFCGKATLSVMVDDQGHTGVGGPKRAAVVCAWQLRCTGRFSGTQPRSKSSLNFSTEFSDISLTSLHHRQREASSALSVKPKSCLC